MITPIITHIGDGVFKLAIDESDMVTLPTGVFEAELVLHIEADQMHPVDRIVEVYNNVSVALQGEGGGLRIG